MSPYKEVNGWTFCKICQVSFVPGREREHERQNELRHEIYNVAKPKAVTR